MEIHGLNFEYPEAPDTRAAVTGGKHLDERYVERQLGRMGRGAYGNLATQLVLKIYDRQASVFRVFEEFGSRFFPSEERCFLVVPFSLFFLQYLLKVQKVRHNLSCPTAK